MQKAVKQDIDILISIKRGRKKKDRKHASKKDKQERKKQINKERQENKKKETK